MFRLPYSWEPVTTVEKSAFSQNYAKVKYIYSRWNVHMLSKRFIPRGMKAVHDHAHDCTCITTATSHGYPQRYRAVCGQLREKSSVSGYDWVQFIESNLCWAPRPMSSCCSDIYTIVNTVAWLRYVIIRYQWITVPWISDLTSTAFRVVRMTEKKGSVSNKGPGVEKCWLRAKNKNNKTIPNQKMNSVNKNVILLPLENEH